MNILILVIVELLKGSLIKPSLTEKVVVFVIVIRVVHHDIVGNIVSQEVILIVVVIISTDDIVVYVIVSVSTNVQNRLPFVKSELIISLFFFLDLDLVNGTGVAVSLQRLQVLRRLSMSDHHLIELLFLGQSQVAGCSVNVRPFSVIMVRNFNILLRLALESQIIEVAQVVLLFHL